MDQHREINPGFLPNTCSELQFNDIDVAKRDPHFEEEECDENSKDLIEFPSRDLLEDSFDRDKVECKFPLELVEFDPRLAFLAEEEFIVLCMILELFVEMISTCLNAVFIAFFRPRLDFNLVSRKHSCSANTRVQEILEVCKYS